MTAQTTAGTAGDAYRANPAPHAWLPLPRDPGERPRCKSCGRERHDERRQA